MINFNERMHEFITDYLTKIINALNQPEYVITDFQVSIKQYNQDNLQAFLSKKVDAVMIFTANYKFNGDPREFYIEVPMMVNGVFVINGKVMVPYSQLVTDFRLNKFKGKYIIDRNRNVYWDKSTYSLNVGNLKYDIDNLSEVPTEYLKLDEEMQKLIKSKWLTPVNYISREFIHELINYCDKKDSYSGLSDLKVEDISEVIKKKLNSAYVPLMNGIRYRFKGGHKFTIGNVYTSELANVIRRSFSLNDSNFNQFSNVNNPLSIQAMSSQIKVPFGNLFNSSVFDLIDVVDTPINNKINTLNSLNRNIELRDGEVFIKVLNKEGEVVELDKYTYLTSEILISRYFDYDTKKPIFNSNGEVKVKYCERTIFTNTFDYIELDPNERTSNLTSVIPMINKSEMARVAMGASMIKQGNNLIESEEPIVGSSDLSELIRSNPLVILSKADGVVSQVTKNYVKVKSDVSELKYEIPYSISSISGNLTNFIPSVSEGEVVKKGDILILPDNISKTDIKLGVNGRVAFNPYFGYNSDDSIVVSESFARKLSATYTFRQVLVLNNVSQLGNIRKPGNYVNSGDVIASFIPKLSNKYVELLNEGEVDEPLVKLVAKNNLTEALIYSVEPYIGSNVYLNEESNEMLSNLFKFDIPKEFINSIPSLPVESESVKPDQVKLVFNYVMVRPAKEGDKITNRYGNKGIISKIVPDKDMFMDSDGIPVDICLAPDSVYARKNISQVFEVCYAFVADAIKKKWNNAKSESDKLEVISLFNGIYGESMSYSEFIDEFNKVGNKMFNFKLNSYSNVNVESVEKMLASLKDSPYKELTYKGRKLKERVLTGPMYFIKLQFIPEDSMSVTPIYKLAGQNEPFYGSGKYRVEGQKVGEMESTALSINNPELLSYYKHTGGVRNNLARLYLDFLSLGVNIDGILNQLNNSPEAQESQLLALKSKFEGKHL